MQGKHLISLEKQKVLPYGKHIIPIQLKTLNLPNGSYIKKLTINGEPHTMKMFVIE